MSAAISHSQPQITTQDDKTVHASAPGPEHGSVQDPKDPQAQELAPDRQPEPPSERQPNAEGGSKTRRPRGFAAMDRKLVSEIARKGGKAAHSAGTAHEFTTEEARVAGRKGGRATHAKRRARTDGEAPPSTPTGGEQS